MSVQHPPLIYFFGTPQLSVWALEEMAKKNIIPHRIITSPDKPAGRGCIITSSPVKKYATTHSIPTWQPEKIDTSFIEKLTKEIQKQRTLFVVFAYGKILPASLLQIPSHGTINLHPSLLPQLRGPSPIRTALLKDMRTAVGNTIILLDEKMDHGPILSQEPYDTDTWPIPGKMLDEKLARHGGALLAHTITRWIAGKITPVPQDHSHATYCHFFKKDDALIDLNDNPYTNYLKICAFDGWPGAYFFDQKGKRVKITSAHMENGSLFIDTVIPAGKNEIKYAQYLQTS